MPNSDNERRPPVVELPDPAVVEMLRGKTPSERLAMVFDAEQTMLMMLSTYLEWRHPDWSAEQVAAEIARRRAHASS